MSNNLFINGQWLAGQGDLFKSLNPAEGSVVWQGNAATAEQVDAVREISADHVPDLSGSAIEEEEEFPVPDDLHW